MRYKLKFRHVILIVLLSATWATQLIPSLSDMYARIVYPTIAFCLSSFSGLVPFAIGDLFIFLSIIGLFLYPFKAYYVQKKKWKQILLNEAEYLAWIYAWFYLAWGLNYFQKDIYERTDMLHTEYSKTAFQAFANDYIDKLNGSYVRIVSINEPLVRRESVNAYRQISDSLGVHRPFQDSPRAKTMLFTPLISMVGVTGSMGPFFCEFTLNGDLLPSQYPATYAHELAHLLGIAGEAEANFYAYQVCIRSKARGIRFSGYLSVLPHVLDNAALLMTEEEYALLVRRIRPEIIEQVQSNRKYWMEKYSPLLGKIQDRIYDWYLKGNNISSGRKNYSEVVGLLVSYYEWEQIIQATNRLNAEEKEGVRQPTLPSADETREETRLFAPQ
ncbi:DUF3810 domain-containing protein [Bacteroides sp. KG123]|uniref:DUF3810 domain-containing protein n=1 Tax=unclassified Bacteroides TaxID=2646097 RepID=UPI003D7F68DC